MTCEVAHVSIQLWYICKCCTNRFTTGAIVHESQLVMLTVWWHWCMQLSTCNFVKSIPMLNTRIFALASLYMNHHVNADTVGKAGHEYWHNSYIISAIVEMYDSYVMLAENKPLNLPKYLLISETHSCLTTLYWWIPSIHCTTSILLLAWQKR